MKGIGAGLKPFDEVLSGGLKVEHFFKYRDGREFQAEGHKADRHKGQQGQFKGDDDVGDIGGIGDVGDIGGIGDWTLGKQRADPQHEKQGTEQRDLDAKSRAYHRGGWRLGKTAMEEVVPEIVGYGKCQYDSSRYRMENVIAACGHGK